MNYFLLSIFLGFFFIVSNAQQSIKITDVSIISMDNPTLMEHQDVIIKNGIIESIRPHTLQSKKQIFEKIIDGKGKYLMPGLVDMHVHLPDGNEPLTKQQAYNYYLETGVTALRSMRGEPTHPAHRDSIKKGLIRAPQLYISYPLPGKDSLLTSDDIAALVKDVKANHYDFVKYLFGISEPKMKEISRSLADSSIILAGHAYHDLKTSIDLGFKSIEHISPLLEAYKKDSAGFNQLLQQMASQHVSFCATASFSKIFGFINSIEKNMNRNGMDHIDTLLANFWKRDYQSFENQCKQVEDNYYQKRITKTQQDLQLFYKLLPQLIKAKVNVLLSPDNCNFNVPGYAILEEMRLYKEAGLSNYDILKTVTVNASTFFNENKWWGMVKQGQYANLILLEKNPLSELENIKTVAVTMVNGKILFEKTAMISKSPK